MLTAAMLISAMSLGTSAYAASSDSFTYTQKG